MPELFETTSRNVEQDCKNMVEILQGKGWVIINGVVRSISPGMRLYYPVDEGMVTVFSASEDAKRWLPEYPGMAENLYVLTPHVMLAHETFRYGLLNSMQIAGGTIAGIDGYKLADNGENL